MASLVAGVQYGLSSQGNFHENKSLMFVKLSDSALRAIEEYTRNKNKINQQPTIQFLKNGGYVSFPSPQSGHDHSFNFSLSSNSDIEGPQGSFECIQQKESRLLESLGRLQCMMKIQAKDDIYETTKIRVTKVEEEQKKNCPKVINATSSDIGKKVNCKRPLSNFGPKRKPSSLYNSSSKLTPQKCMPNSKPNNFVGNGSKSNLTNHHHSKPPFNNHSNQKTGNPDIIKFSVTDKLIHLLALRPHKKAEIYDRLARDGTRYGNEKRLRCILKQVSYMKDNSYYLSHHLWNEVKEDWPLYSEQDKQMLKRREQQNFTARGSDASSGSGQSQTRTHPGRPPTTVSSSASKLSPIGGGTTLKRPGYFETSDGLPTKKQRISHFSSKTTRNSLSGQLDSSQSNQRPGSRWSSHNNNVISSLNMDMYPPMASSDSYNNGYSLNNNFNSVSERKSVKESDKHRVYSSSKKYDPGLVSAKIESSGINRARKLEPNRVLSQAIRHGHGGHHDNRNRWSNNKVSSSSNKVHTRGSSSTNIDNEDKTVTSMSEYPEYRTTYTTIRTAEQRSRYKADFTAHYSEYRNVHAVVDKVSKRFLDLEARLKQQEEGSEGWKDIKYQIINEYQEIKKDHRYEEAKTRFQYLHEKLSHIKRLVLEYDSTQTSGY